MKNHFKTASYVADLLDNRFNILGFKFGIDPLLGLIPGAGDVVSLILSLYIVWIGVEMKLPKGKIFQMIVNVVLDFAVGLIPILGDFMDFASKANILNLSILKEHMESNIIEAEIIG